MKIQRCFDILDLQPGASPEEAKQAYKDVVNVWHPDRFSNNPRLRKKAELKLKEINAAYAEIQAFIASGDRGEARDGRPPDSGSKPSDGSVEAEPRDTVEMVAEAGTRFVLGVWSYLSKTLARMNDGSGRDGTPRGPGNG
jgi:curved DNA-binding protein CbpA